MFRINIASGAIVKQFSTGIGISLSAFDGFEGGLAVFGQPQSGGADVQVTMSASPSPATQNSNLTYTITVTNNGLLTADNVAMTDIFASGVNFVSSATSVGTCTGTTTVSCNLGTMANGASATITIVVTPTQAGTLVNTANITSTTPDPITSDNAATTSTTVSGPTATHFSVTAPGTATAGTAFNFTVTALDATNATVTGYSGIVHFTSTDGAAVLPANSTLTNGVGSFSATLKTNGSQTITATDTVTATITGASGAITVSTLATATHFSVTAPAAATAGTAFNFTVTALDATNATVTGYAGTVHFTSSDGQAVLPANATLTNGVGTFSTTLKTTGAQTITATDTVTASITGTSATITVSAAAATHFTVSAPATATAGTAFNFTVTALDASNATATAYSGTVHFTSTDGQAVLPANATLTNGVGIFSATLKTSGARTITATDTLTASITGASGAITVGAAAATHFAVAAPATATGGSAFNLTVTALDQFTNTATSYAGLVHFTSSDGQAVLPANSTLTNGLGTFSATLKTNGSQTVTATDTVTAAITGTSGTITVTGVGPAPMLTISKTHTGNFTQGQQGAQYSLTVANSGTAPTSGNTNSTTVQSTGSIYATGGGSTAPTMIALPSGATSVAFNSVTGSITTGCASTEGCIVLNNGTGNNANDPDGVGAAPATSSNTGTSSISGLTAPGAGYLVGLFVPAGGPAGAAPAALDFTSSGLGTSFTSLSPQLDQVFFIGDGLTGNGTGTQQTFNIPTGAGQLWLGISDAGGYVGAPGAYGDNLGTYTVGFTVNAPSSSTVTVTETAPSGLTLVSMAGTGWTCGGANPANVCTRSDALAAGASYPVITVSVNVAANATSPQVNTAAVTGGGSAPANASDSTVIVSGSTAATHFSVSAPGAATAGTAFNFTVTALTASNTTATGYAGTVNFTSTDGAAATAVQRRGADERSGHVLCNAEHNRRADDYGDRHDHGFHRRHVRHDHGERGCRSTVGGADGRNRHGNCDGSRNQLHERFSERMHDQRYSRNAGDADSGCRGGFDVYELERRVPESDERDVHIYNACNHNDDHGYVHEESAHAAIHRRDAGESDRADQLYAAIHSHGNFFRPKHKRSHGDRHLGIVEYRCRYDQRSRSRLHRVEFRFEHHDFRHVERRDGINSAHTHELAHHDFGDAAAGRIVPARAARRAARDRNRVDVDARI